MFQNIYLMYHVINNKEGRNHVMLLTRMSKIYKPEFFDKV